MVFFSDRHEPLDRVILTDVVHGGGAGTANAGELRSWTLLLLRGVTGVGCQRSSSKSRWKDNEVSQAEGSGNWGDIQSQVTQWLFSRVWGILPKNFCLFERTFFSGKIRAFKFFKFNFRWPIIEYHSLVLASFFRLSISDLNIET